MKHLLSIEHLAKEDIEHILKRAGTLKKERGNHSKLPLRDQTWAMIFSKSSTRTRVSFEVGVHELGGKLLFLNANDIQLGRGEPIKDTARVLGRMVHGAIIRTYAQSDVDEFARYSQIPTINALTDWEHPCQILTDIFTFQEKRGPIHGKKVAFFGDGACNVPISWIFASAKLDFELAISAPPDFQPSIELIQRSKGNITVTENPDEAAANSDLLYTDVWVSMGKEKEAVERLEKLKGFQINSGTKALAAPDALVMHCLPAYRDKEIAESFFEEHADTIFDQAENRLHVQKAILEWIVCR